MIQFNNLSKEMPFLVLREKYDQALRSEQKSIDALNISSYNTETKEVSSRYVNLKYIINNEFIFFTNYVSPKAISFNLHDQIAALLYWSNINLQIRIKAKIKKTSAEFNQNYFSKRSPEKNALAISSNQSKPIESYGMVKENFKKTLENDNLKKCPSYWGGYSLTPYEIEFWEGDKHRLNKRDLYILDEATWNHFILQP